MTSAQETIAELIDLAQQGEINPWDVQVMVSWAEVMADSRGLNEVHP